MSLWSTIGYRVQEIWKKMIGAKTIEQTLHVVPAISSQMEQAIQLWSDMYKNKAPWIHEPTYNDPTRVVSLGLPSMIASEKARMALIEWQSEITTPTKEVEVNNPDYVEPREDEFGNIIPSSQPETITEDKPIGDIQRAEFLNQAYKDLKKALRKNQLEYAIAKGGMVIKPYVVKNDPNDNNYPYSICFNFIQADNFFPLAFDISGKITEAVFIDTKFEKNVVYRRLEYHKCENNRVHIVNKAYKSTNLQVENGMYDTLGVDLGQEVELTSVSEWSKLQSEVYINNVNQPLFVYFKVPQANTIDTLSPLGASGYSRAVQLIKDADMQYSRLLWEYEAGEMAIDIDRDALQFLEDSDKSHSVLNSLQQRLFRKVDLGESDTYQPYAPTLRDTSMIQGLNTILMRIEDVCALSRGTISDASAEARTATELKILKQRTYSANKELQDSLEIALTDIVSVMDILCDLYKITPKGEYDVSFEWDDSIIEDVEAELTKRLTLMQNGLISKLELREWYFGETERQAKEALAEIQQDSIDNMETELAKEFNSNRISVNKNNSNVNNTKKEDGMNDAKSGRNRQLNKTNN